MQADATGGGDRYTYVRNNPVRYADPTGQDAWWCTTAACGYSYYAWRSPAATRSYLRTYGIITNGLSGSEMYAVGRAALLAADWLAGRTGLRPDEAFRRAHGPVTVNKDSTANISTGTCGTVGGTVTCRSAPDTLTTLHEFGHVFDNWYPAASGDSGHLASDHPTRHLSARRPDDVIGFDKTYMTRTVLGYKCNHSPCMGNSPQQWPRYYVDNPLLRPQEEFADMYLNYLLDDVAIYQETNGFADDVYGSARRSHMDNVMNILLVNLGMLP